MKAQRILLITSIVAVFFISFTYFNNKSAIASPLTTIDAGQVYRGPSYCLQCHPDEKAKWDESRHAIAYNEPNFQSQWRELGSPTSCLKCHTTGYNELDGTYTAKGVTCEQCHGLGDTMSLDKSVNLCAKCHTDPYPTYNEWLQSGPGHTGATCDLCHTPHSQQLKGQNSTEVCAQCHQTHVNDVAQTKHGDAKLECKVCHMYKSPADFKNNVSANTGHTFFMTSTQLDCTSCHNRALVKHNVLGEKAAACLTCHGDIHKLQLRLVNGTTLALNDPVALCGECHNERLIAWEQGTHGSSTEKYAPCTECHNPHDPVVAGIPMVYPVPAREPAPSAPIENIAVVGLTVSVLLIVTFVLRRRT